MNIGSQNIVELWNRYHEIVDLAKVHFTNIHNVSCGPLWNERRKRNLNPGPAAITRYRYFKLALPSDNIPTSFIMQSKLKI